MLETLISFNLKYTTDVLSFQTILPLIQCFGKGLSDDGIDAVVRIGNLSSLTESFCSF